MNGVLGSSDHQPIDSIPENKGKNDKEDEKCDRSFGKEFLLRELIHNACFCATKLSGGPGGRADRFLSPV
jgi:hypothetical protein